MSDLMRKQIEHQAGQNTDRELWREREGDYYADSIHVTKGGGIGIDCGGSVIVMPLRKWHDMALRAEAAEALHRQEFSEHVLTKAAMERSESALALEKQKREAAEKDAERLRNGEVIGFRKDDHKGRAWWSGGTWLNKGQEVIVVDAIDAQEPK
jgi:hypothetical protein